MWIKMWRRREGCPLFVHDIRHKFLCMVPCLESDWPFIYWLIRLQDFKSFYKLQAMVAREWLSFELYFCLFCSNGCSPTWIDEMHITRDCEQLDLMEWHPNIHTLYLTTNLLSGGSEARSQEQISMGVSNSNCIFNSSGYYRLCLSLFVNNCANETGVVL